MKRVLVAAALASLFALGTAVVAPSAETGGGGALPTETDLWLAPDVAVSSDPPLGRALADLQAGRAASALAVFESTVSDPLLGGYATLYAARADLQLGRRDDALRQAKALVNAAPGGALREASLWLLADASEAAADWAGAVSALQRLTSTTTSRTAEAYLRRARDAEQARDTSLAVRSYAKVYYGFPLGAEADDAGRALARLAPEPPADQVVLALGRAQQLYAARRAGDAREAYLALRGRVSGDDRALVDLRLAECDVQSQRFTAGRDELRSYMNAWSVQLVEAQYYYLAAVRGLKHDDEYVDLTRTFVEKYPTNPLAEAALNDLASFYTVQQNDDAKAAEVYADLYRRYPTGTYADRAAWKAGWWAYKKGDYGAAVQQFGAVLPAFPHSDLRPSFLYWSARANERLGRGEAARSLYRQAVSDYRNSYYGRLAAGRLASASAAVVPAGGPRVVAASPAASPAPTPLRLTPGAPPVNAAFVQRLLAVGLYDDAVAEMRRIETETGATPLVDATIAYALNRKGDLRPAINAMRRAYPQFIAEGGETLPLPILSVIFPVQYWDIIRQRAAEERLDPYLMAALIAQESTFQADVRSAANAWGLMQLLPTTARLYAPRLAIRPFSTGRLTDPQVNVRIGMAYFSDLLAQFRGDSVSALAAYNAGPQRLLRWRAERPGVDTDEFIDDIPFPETQNYVKRILGTADDYRFLYAAAATPAVRESRR